MSDDIPAGTKPSSGGAPAAAASQPTLGILLVAGLVVGAVGVAFAVRMSSAPPATVDGPPAPAPAAARPTRAGVVPAREGSGRSKWTGSTKPGWARNGSRQVAFELAAERDIAVWMKRVRPSLAVRCLYGRTEVFVVPGSAASVESNDSHTVRLAFDDRDEIVQQWEESSDAQELFAPDGVALARQLARASTLHFGFTPYGAALATADFEVAGFDRLIGVVAKTCGWKP
jgi:hypothetical protein